jgi:hypothetical protein
MNSTKRSKHYFQNEEHFLENKSTMAKRGMHFSRIQERGRGRSERIDATGYKRGVEGGPNA